MNVPVAVDEDVDVADEVAVAVVIDETVAPADTDAKDVALVDAETEAEADDEGDDVAMLEADADAEAEAEGEGETETKGEAEADADAEAEGVIEEFAAPTTIRGQQNWSVVEYRPAAKIHP